MIRKRCASLFLIILMLFSCIPSGFAAKKAVKPDKIQITGSQVVAKGKKITLKAAVTPEGASQKVKWKSGDKKIATVSSKGVVKGIKAGTVKITATSAENSKIRKTITITVAPKPVTKITISAKTTKLDLSGTKSVTLKAKAKPSEAGQSFEWKSSNTKVAVVDKKGKVTAKSAGTAKITASATDGSKKTVSVTITVTDSSEITGTYTVWCADTEVAKKLLDDFKKENPKYAALNLIVESHSEADAVTDLISGSGTPDLFTFAQDQLARLVVDGKLAAVNTSGFASDCGEGGVNAVSLHGKAYGYPITSDNGYFLYFDKNVISNPGSMEAILADCEAAGKTFHFEINNGWYNSSFFFGAGCTIDFDVDSNGNFSSVTADVDSANGLKAAKAMYTLVSSPAFVDNSVASHAEGAAALVSGTWDANDVRELFGSGYAAAKLPAAGGFQLSSYAGYKIIGVRPQDAERQKIAMEIAEYLSSSDAQVLRHDEKGWLPARKSAQSRVSLTVAEKALLAQNHYARPQKSIHGGFWDLSRSFGKSLIHLAQSGNKPSDNELRSLLKTYQNGLDALE